MAIGHHQWEKMDELELLHINNWWTKTIQKKKQSVD